MATAFKRHLGVRVAAVAFVSALGVLGLEAPVYGATPTISSFSPTSGPTGCVVVIRGTNFDNPIVTSVDIGGTPVSAFKIELGGLDRFLVVPEMWCDFLNHMPSPPLAI